MTRGLFVGLTTLDVVYLVDRYPGPNEKVSASTQMVAAGGPASNAAVAFAWAGGEAQVASVFGDDPIAQAAKAELQSTRVSCWDAGLVGDGDFPISSAIVQRDLPHRMVVSKNAGGRTAEKVAHIREFVNGADIVLIDGHYPELALAACRRAQQIGVQVVLDGGSWKEATPSLLPLVDVAICSATFHPPGVTRPHDVLMYLREHGITLSAITNGADPVLWLGPREGPEVLVVPQVDAVDTLAAGDFFHGAFVHAWAGQERRDPESFNMSLEWAAVVASRSTEHVGTRSWLATPPPALR